MQTSRMLCIVLHLLVVVFTSIIYGLWKNDLSSMVSSDADKLGHTMHYVQIGLQVLTVVYGAAMVFTTQQLAMKIQLSKHQYLTTTHDISLAWAGLGAALMSLRGQWRLRVSLWQVLTIVIYLTCIALLHVSIPTLFSIDTSIESHPTTSKLALPNITSIPMANLTRSVNALSALAGLTGVESTSTLGLRGNIIYDTVDRWAWQDTLGYAAVNATFVDVTCGTPANVTLSNGVSDNTGGTGNVTLFRNSTPWTFNWIPFTLPSLQLPDVVMQTDSATATDILLYSTFPFVDSMNASGKVLSTNYTSADGVLRTLELQVMSCSVSLIPAIGQLDMVGRALSGSVISLSNGPHIGQPLTQHGNTSLWHPFTGRPAYNDTMVLRTPWQSVWSSLLNQNRTKRSLTMGDSQAVGMCDMQFNPSCLFTSDEMFLMEELLLTSDAGAPAKPQLYTLENSLADMIAAIIWSTVKNNYDLGYWGSGEEFTGSISVESQTLKSGILQLSGLQVLTSFVTSLIAFVGCIVLTWGKLDDMDAAGILQVMYMSRARYTDVEPFDITQVVKAEKGRTAPSDLALRRAGLVKMRLFARRPVKSEIREDEEDNWLWRETDCDNEALRSCLMRPLPPLPSQSPAKLPVLE